MYGSVQPTGSKNPQSTAVENQSVGQFGDWEVINEEHACCKDLPEKVRSGISLGRSIGRAWHVVKESVSVFFNGIGAFFKKHFGEQSGAVSTVRAQVGTGNVSAGKTSISVGVRQSVVSRVPSPSDKIPAKPSDTLGTNAKVSNKKLISEISSTQSTASVKKSVLSSSPQCRLVDVPGDGNCGLYAVLVGMRSINPSEFGKPTHPDQGPHPLPNEEQEPFVQRLRTEAAEIAKQQLREEDGSYSKESLETIRRLEKQYQELTDDDFKYVAQVVEQPIEVYSQQPGGFVRTLFQPNGETTFLFPGDSDPSDKNIIRLHLDGGHYQLMVPSETA